MGDDFLKKNLFIRMDEEEEVSFREPWDPHSEVGHWVEGKEGESRWTWILCSMHDCSQCLEGDRPMVRYKVPVMHDGDPKTMHCVLVLYKQVLAFKSADSGSFFKRTYRVERTSASVPPSYVMYRA